MISEQLTPDAVKILSKTDRIAAPIQNPCFWGRAAVYSAGVGTVGAALANGEAVGTAVAQNYPSWINRALSWLYARGVNPAPVAAGLAAAKAQVGSICSGLQ